MKGTIPIFLTLLLFSPFIFAAPPNDDCTSATALTVNSGESCTAASIAIFTAATVSPEPNTCTTATTADIWYQFEATSTSHTIALSNFIGANPQPVVMVLYEGADCGTMTQIECSTNNVILANSLLLGETYKLRLYYDVSSPILSNSFSVCVSTPPPPTGSNQSDCIITTVNYDFENPPPPANQNYPIFLNHNVVPGWRTTASDQMMEFWPVPNYENVPSYSGNQFIELNANLVSGVYQDYETPEVTIFSYGFAHRGRQGTDTCQLMAGPPGGPYEVVDVVSTGNTAWSYNTGEYEVPAGQTVTRFIFQSVSSVGGASVGNYLDAITFTANNGILSPNPYYMQCGELVANIEAAGTGTWVAHSDNPSATTIADASNNTTTISDFGEAGTYYYDWVTEYCTSTLEISFMGDEVPAPVVSNVTYCQGETAAALTAEALPGNTLNWFDGTPPIPDTSTLGTTTYYVSQVAPNWCESVPAPITVTIIPPGDPVTDFTLPIAVCADGGVVQPNHVTNYTTGGTYNAETGLTIDAATGEINPATSTPGSYNVVYDVPANMCTSQGSSTAPITINAVPVTPDVTIIQPDCDTTTGTVTINSPVGVEYTYSLDGTNYQVSAQFSGVVSGTYTLYVMNIEGCEATYNSIVIDDPLDVPPIPDVTVVQPDCDTATADVTVTAPVGAEYMYSINGIDYQASPMFNNVVAGDYTINVQNTDGCINTTDITVNPQPPTPIPPTATVTQPDCNLPAGVLTVNSPTGAGLQYSVDGINYQSGNVFEGLAQGDYTVTVMNSYGCSNTSAGSYTVNAPFDQAPAPQLSASQPDCFTGTGIISVNSPLGSGYSYSIDGTVFQTSTLFTNLSPATYTVLAKNPDGCISSSSITVFPAPDAPAVADVTVTQSGCDSEYGTFVINSPVGSGLHYSIDGVNFQLNPVFTDLEPDTYTVTVQNTAGCISVTNPIVINPGLPIPPRPVISAIQPTCDVQTGGITVNLPLGANYTYSVDGVNYQSEILFEELAPGATYTVTVQNSAGCTKTSLPVTIQAAPELISTPTVNVENPECGETRGLIIVDDPVGDGFTYSINNIYFQPSPIFTNVTPGDYTVIIKNSYGCTESVDVTVDAPPVASDAGVVSGPNQVCENDIVQYESTVPDGVWSVNNENLGTIDETGQLTVLSSGNLIVYYTVQNPNECPTTEEFSVWAVGAPRFEFDDAVLCMDLETGEYGSVELNTGFSSVDYAFVWYKGSIPIDDEQEGYITVTEPGEYSVDVTNLATGCTGTGSAQVTISSQPEIRVEVGEDFSYLQSISIEVIGGAGDYVYQLNNGEFQQIPTFTGIREGEYTVTVKDLNGCGSITTTVFALNYPRYFSPNGDGEHDYWYIKGLSQMTDIQIYIYDRYGKVVGYVSPNTTGWDGTFNGEILPATDYWFTIDYNSSDGTRKEFKAHFSLIR